MTTTKARRLIKFERLRGRARSFVVAHVEAPTGCRDYPEGHVVTESELIRIVHHHNPLWTVVVFDD